MQSICQSLPCPDLVNFPVLSQFEPQVGWLCVVVCRFRCHCRVSLWRLWLWLWRVPRHADKPACVHSNVPVCTGTTHTCVTTCGCGASRHGDVLNLHTVSALSGHTLPTPLPSHHTHAKTVNKKKDIHMLLVNRLQK